jgi:hypothetical protein
METVKNINGIIRINLSAWSFADTAGEWFHGVLYTSPRRSLRMWLAVWEITVVSGR